MVKGRVKGTLKGEGGENDGSNIYGLISSQERSDGAKADLLQKNLRELSRRKGEGGTSRRTNRKSEQEVRLAKTRSSADKEC